MTTRMTTGEFERLSRIVGALFDRVEQGGVASLSVAEQVVYHVWVATGQIDNGGFDLFFFNACGDFASETVEAFRAIGAARRAAAVAHAIALFGGDGPPRDRERRHRALDGLIDTLGDDAFDAVDREFYAAESSEEVDALLAAYVAARRAEFRDHKRSADAG